jgi:hypothetical protein
MTPGAARGGPGQQPGLAYDRSGQRHDAQPGDGVQAEDELADGRAGVAVVERLGDGRDDELDQRESGDEAAEPMSRPGTGRSRRRP